MVSHMPQTTRLDMMGSVIRNYKDKYGNQHGHAPEQILAVYDWCRGMDPEDVDETMKAFLVSNESPLPDF